MNNQLNFFPSNNVRNLGLGALLGLMFVPPLVHAQAVAEPVHFCAPTTLGSGDGGKKDDSTGGGGDGGKKDDSTGGGGDGGKKDDSTGGGGDGKVGAFQVPITSPKHSDLSISRVKANSAETEYALSYCVINRGGRAALSPITVEVRSTDSVLHRYTYFGKPLASKKGFCVENKQAIRGEGPGELTIVVSTDVNEYTARDNRCLVQWSSNAMSAKRAR